MCRGQGEVRGAASGISGTFPEDLEVGVSFSSQGCHYLSYGLDLPGTAVLHHPFLLPFLSGVIAPQISRCTPATEFHLSSVCLTTLYARSAPGEQTALVLFQQLIELIEAFTWHPGVPLVHT